MSEIESVNNLSDLYCWMRRNPHASWSDLPVFGGAEPARTHGIWSWDEDSILWGSCADDLEIVSRSALRKA